MALFLIRNKSMFYDHNISTKLLHLNLENDYIQLEKAFDIFKIMLDPILNLEPYDKIGIEDSSNSELFSNNNYLDANKLNFILYLDKYKIYQSVSRWYWSQKRDIIFDKLIILFEEYKKVLDKVKLNNIRNTNIYKKLLNDIVEFNNKLIEKLNILKITYNDSIVSEYIDKIIQIIEPPKELSIIQELDIETKDLTILN
jgi:hypothetical protein